MVRKLPSSQPIKSHLFLAFKEKMNAKTAAIQGSGWGWLGYNPETSKLEIVTTANQDPLLCMSFFSYRRSRSNCHPRKPTCLSSALTSGSTYVPSIPTAPSSLISFHRLSIFNIRMSSPTYVFHPPSIHFSHTVHLVPQGHLERYQLQRGRDTFPRCYALIFSTAMVHANEGLET